MKDLKNSPQLDQLDKLLHANSPEQKSQNEPKAISKPKKHGSSARESDIQRLKNALNSEKAKTSELQKKEVIRRANTPTVMHKTDALELVYTGKIADHAYHAELPIAKGSATTELFIVMKEFVHVVNDLLNGRDLRAPKKAHVLDAENKPTSELMKDDQGRQLYMAGSLDRLKADLEYLANSEEAMTALRTISEVLEKGRSGSSTKYTTKSDLDSRFAQFDWPAQGTADTASSIDSDDLEY